MIHWHLTPTLDELTALFCQHLEKKLQAPERTAFPLEPGMSVALTGGTSAVHFHRAWARRWRDEGWPDDSFRFFWSDERLVPPDHPDSNFRMAKETLLRPAGVPNEQVHRIPTDGSTEDCARRYAEELQRLLPAPEGVPRFSIVMLGLGDDGHTASLFPHTDAFAGNDLLVRGAASTEAHPHPRITFTPKLINAADEVWFLIVGKKEEAVERLFERQTPTHLMPALAIDPDSTHIHAFVANEAATRIRDRVV